MPDFFVFTGLRFPRDGSVLSGVDVSVGAEESVALFGPNGGGKSSVMRVIAGTIPKSQPLAPVAYLPQTPYMFRGSVHKNLTLGLDEQETHEAERLAEELGVERLFAKASSEVSVGEAQRISLARTLASAAPLVLLDEPLAPIHAASRGDVAETIRRATASRALLWSTHSIDAVRAAADRLVVIDGGEILQEGPVTEVIGSPLNDRVAVIVGAI